MRSAVLAIVMALFAAMALAQDSDTATGKETTDADRKPDKAAAKTVDAASSGATDEVQLPPGFKLKKRGDITLYCIKGKATGTRFQTESCFDKAQLKDYLLAREQNNRDFDRSRSICSDPGVCAPQ